MGIIGSVTLIAFVRMTNVPGNKTLPTSMVAHVQGVLKEIISRDFMGPDGKPVAERTMASRLRMTQNQINNIRNWHKDSKKPPNIGTGALLALSEYTHQSIDVILGRELPLPWQQRQEQLDEIVAKSEELLALLDPIVPFSPTSKVGKLRAEIQRLGAAARQQKVMDERVLHVNEMGAPKSRRKLG